MTKTEPGSTRGHHTFSVPHSAGLWLAPRRHRLSRAEIQKTYRSNDAQGLKCARVYLSPDVRLALRLSGRTGEVREEAAKVIEAWAAHLLHELGVR